MPRVYNRRAGDAPEDAIYVGRPTLLGNDFKGPNAVERHREWINAPEQAELRKFIREQLRGRDLVCWCAPAPCHADVILEIANADEVA